MLVGTDRAKHRRGRISLDRLQLPHRDVPRNGVPDQEKIGGAAASTEKVLPGGLIGVGNARIPDRRLHVQAGGVNVDRENGAAVLEGRGVGVPDIEAKAGNIADGDWRADEVSGLVKALGPVNKRILKCDDEAAVGKGSHVVRPGTLIEDVDENVALDEAAIGIIDRRADAIDTSVIKPSHDKPAVGQSSNVRVVLIYTITIVSAVYGRHRNDVCPGLRLDRKKDVVIEEGV